MLGEVRYGTVSCLMLVQAWARVYRIAYPRLGIGLVLIIMDTFRNTRNAMLVLIANQNGVNKR